jgi:hypothetical protein
MSKSYNLNDIIIFGEGLYYNQQMAGLNSIIIYHSLIRFEIPKKICYAFELLLKQLGY